MCSKGNLAAWCSPVWHEYFIEISNLGFRESEECTECLENTLFGEVFSSGKKKMGVVSVSHRLDHVVHCHILIGIIGINFM